MNKFIDENFGFEPIIPTEIVDLLNRHKAMFNNQRQIYVLISKDNSLLDEHELAMVE